MGKGGSFLAAHNVIIKLTFESETPISPAGTMRVTYGEEAKGNYVRHMAGKTAEPSRKAWLATDKSCALMSLSLLYPLTSTASLRTFTASEQ